MDRSRHERRKASIGSSGFESNHAPQSVSRPSASYTSLSRNPGRLPSHAAERTRESGCALVADLLRNALYRLASREKLSCKRDAPGREIVHRRLGGPRAEMLSEPRA